MLLRNGRFYVTSQEGILNEINRITGITNQHT